MKDIVIDECELSIAANKIQRNTDKILEVMSTYNKILAAIQSNGGICDNEINSKLSEIAEEVAFCGEQLKTNIGAIGVTVNGGIERAEKADSFKFPQTAIEGLLEQLMSNF